MTSRWLLFSVLSSKETHFSCPSPNHFLFLPVFPRNPLVGAASSSLGETGKAEHLDKSSAPHCLWVLWAQDLMGLAPVSLSPEDRQKLSYAFWGLLGRVHGVEFGGYMKMPFKGHGSPLPVSQVLGHMLLSLSPEMSCFHLLGGPHYIEVDDKDQGLCGL